MNKELSARISKKLKTLRKERGWSLDVASKNTSVSKAMLGQIERGESSPTISTLWKIASGFNESFSSFVENITKASTKKFLIRRGKFENLHPKDDKIQVMSLFPFDESLKFELFILELLPGCEHLSPPHQKGVIEHVIASEGNVEIFSDGEWKKLRTQEGIRFSADQIHGYRNLNKKRAVIYDLIHY